MHKKSIKGQIGSILLKDIGMKKRRRRKTSLLRCDREIRINCRSIIGWSWFFGSRKKGLGRKGERAKNRKRIIAMDIGKRLAIKRKRMKIHI